MKWFLLFVFLLGFLIRCSAIDYYSQGSVAPNVLTNWNVNPGGGGATPGSFTNPGDKFIIQSGHSMVTTAIWTVGGTGSTLQIQNGGTLTGNHTVILTGTFQIDNGGTYIHSNTGSVAQGAGLSIFSGTESFAATSNVEIRNWGGAAVGLPNSPAITWGNLIINLTADVGNWNLGLSTSDILTIAGNLDIRSNYVLTPSELRFSGTGDPININIGGDLLLSGNSIVNLKNNSASNATGNILVQVNGNISLINTAQLSLGNPLSGTTVGSFDLRFKGNFSASVSTTITSNSNIAPYLVANGTAPQTLSCAPLLNCNFKVSPGALVNQSGSLANASSKVFAILGTYNDNGFSNAFSGTVDVGGGTLNSTGPLAMGINLCRVGTGNGTYTGGSGGWQTASGTRGRINFTGNTVTFTQIISAALFVGSLGPGDVYMTNSKIRFNAGGAGKGGVYLNPASILSIDDNSFIDGSADYLGGGGTLRIGSSDGITATGNTTNGNIRTGGLGTKSYNVGNSICSFEYFGSSVQVTGNGLPDTVRGTLKINNTAGMGTSGVTLTKSTVVRDTLDLTSGKLTTTLANLITLVDTGAVNLPVPGTSYITGPMKKIGSASFSFPIGKGNSYAPLALTGTGVATDEYIAEYFTANPRSVIGSPYQNPPIDHMSVLEYWTVDRSAGTTAKNVTLEATAYSDATLLSDLHVLRWDGSIWADEGNTGFTGVSTGPVTSNVVSNFFGAGTPTPFTFGSITSFQNPLPINLVSFNASMLTTTKAMIDWELAAPCSPAARFEIQKAGAGKNFIAIGTTGGSTISQLYTYMDNDLKNGISYYRIKMMDENGKITYSRTVAVMNGVNGLLLTSLIPTVISHTAALTVASSKDQQFDLVITDMQGRIVQRQNHTITAGNTNIQLTTDRLAAGVYQIAGITSEGKTNSIRFIKQ
ncbi:MAG: T9SS type A sorting domain-containing protein [Bacteroidota bacterium]|nr:T9SS type A sorting domain-containing protein [Bacteroidota bacterium]